MRPLEEMEKQSPVAQREETKWELGSRRCSWPRTMDSSQRGKGAFPPDTCHSSYICARRIVKWNPKFEMG